MHTKRQLMVEMNIKSILLSSYQMIEILSILSITAFVIAGSKGALQKTLSLIAFLCVISTSLSAQKNDSIPFIYHGHIYIPAIINDSIKCNIIYDTGAANMFGVDSVFLAHSAWKPQKSGNAFTGGSAGKTKVRVITDKTQINAGTINDEYSIVPIFQLRDVVDCHADGIMGIKNVENYPFEINFEHRYLKQHKKGLPNTDGYQKLPIRFENHRLLFQAETIIKGTNIKGWYLMDTGSGSSIDFTSKTACQYCLDTITTKRYYTDFSQAGIGDKKQEVIVDMLSDTIIIGNDTISRLPISYVPDGVGAMGDRPYQGIVGNDIWDSFNIIIDVKNSALYLRRFKPQDPETPTYDYSFRNRTDICRGWIVSGLVRGGVAVKAGMEIGDTITAINGKNVSEYSWDEEYVIPHTPKQTITLTTAYGQQTQITLEAKEQWP